MKSIIQAFIVTLFLPFSTLSILAQPSVNLVTVATSLQDPVDIAHAGDGSNRLFFVEQRGVIRIYDGSTVLATPFLDIRDRVSCCGERGLLGLVFNPDYATNGFFYVNYTNNSGDTHVSRFTVDGVDPNLADASSEVVLLTIDQPFSNHNGGDLNFGPDGNLYIATGDGGSGGDPGNRAQDRMDLLGKLLRIDVDGGVPFAIPPDNPFVGDPTTLDEIWAIGLRNPWRFSFDRLTGDMWIADVGQSAREEINFQPASSSGGENYGWRCYEGNIPFNTTGCEPASNYDFPIFDYTHGSGCSVTGGFVYRGLQNPDLYGRYIFVDYCSGNLWSTLPDGEGGWITTPLEPSLGFGFTSFGEDEEGELYISNADGTIYRIEGECPGFNIELAVTDESSSGSNDGAIDLTVNNGTPPYNYLWSNGETTEDIVGLAAGTYSVTVTDQNGCVLSESAEVGVSATCGSPTELTVTATTHTTADISWSDEGAPFYRVNYWCLTCAETGVERVFSNTNSITLTGLEECSIYLYRVLVKCIPDGGVFASRISFFATNCL